MELTLNEKEATQLLLDEVNAKYKFDPPFNHIKIDAGYSTIRSATFSYEKPEDGDK
jgi:hypothetical protein